MKRKTLRRILYVVAGLVLVVYLVAGLLAYNVLSVTSRKYVAAAVPQDVENVNFPSRGQTYSVYGFYYPGPQSAPALITVHGWKASRHHEWDVEKALALQALGYTVLAIDLADNGGDTVDNGRISMGYEERYDVLGAFDYLLARGFTAERIGLVGTSMGAATVLMTAAMEPRITAIWADSPYTRADAVASELSGRYGFPSIITLPGMLWSVVLTGHPIWQAAAINEGRTLAANGQSVQLVHCDQDDFVAYHHSVDLLAAYQTDKVAVDLWTTVCVAHTTSFRDYRDEYLTRIDAFFKSHLS